MSLRVPLKNKNSSLPTEQGEGAQAQDPKGSVGKGEREVVIVWLRGGDIRMSSGRRGWAWGNSGQWTSRNREVWRSERPQAE